MRRKIRDEILWKAFRIILLLAVFIFFWLVTLSNSGLSNMFLFFAVATILLLLLITIPRWRKYYNSQYNYASEFAETLETKTKELTHAFIHLDQNPFPKEVYWINFKICPSTLKIEFEIHSTMEEIQLNTFENIRNEVEALISVNESTISGLRKKGWDAEDNIELSLEMIQIWISKTWNRVPFEKSKIKSTISVKDRRDFFNMTSNKWEEKPFLT